MSTEKPPPLRAVGSGEKSSEAEPRQEPLTILQAAHARDQRALLAALLVRIAATIETGAAPRDLAALSRRVMEVCQELAALDARAEQERAAGELPGDEPWDPSWF